MKKSRQDSVNDMWLASDLVCSQSRGGLGLRVGHLDIVHSLLHLGAPHGLLGPPPTQDTQLKFAM